MEGSSQLRCAGSFPSARILTSTCPSCNSGSGRSSTLNVSGLMSPTGGLALMITRVVLGMDAGMATVRSGFV
jgi:hypothetical protein